MSIEVIEYSGVERQVQHLPIGSLRDYGVNPHDEPMFRVIWSESRRAICGGNHKTYDKSAGGPSNDAALLIYGRDPNQIREEAGYKWVPLYPGVRAWVLEKWQSPFQFTGMGPEQYDREYRDPATNLLELGPYPIRGDYSHSYTFPAGHEPGRSKVIEVINWVEAGRNYTLNEHQVAIQQSYDMREKDWERQNQDRQRDARRVGNGNPINITPGKRTEPVIRHTAEELDLPIRHGAFTG